MSLITNIKALIIRVEETDNSNLSQERKDRIILYSNGLESKLQQANFALNRIHHHCNDRPDPPDNYGFSGYEKIHFYSDAF
ncbi:hypothetical protein ACFL7M_05675 [Thermodesulfobacteriota bacterium]